MPCNHRAVLWSTCSSNQVSRGRAAPSNPVPLTPVQVLFASQVLALQHRRIQPVSAGGRRELLVQQAPQGTSAENREVGVGKSQPGSRHPLSLQLLDPPECGNGFVEAGEECDCGSVQVSGPGRLPCEPGTSAWAPGRESTEWEGAIPPLHFFLRPSGVQPSGGQLLQEMHPDARCHVQRWALLSPLQGEDRASAQRRAGEEAKKRLDALDRRRE